MQIFPLKKLKLVVSDFHLGKGKFLPDGSQNLLEDFTADRQFIDFLHYYMTGNYKRCEVELIVNGDFFNLLQVDYRDKFTDFISESDALHKTMRILHGHEAVFNKMAEFSQEAHHSITFVLGNHDPGLLWEGVQEALKLKLGGQVRFVMESHRFDGVHVEHGNQYLADNRYNRKNYFLTKNLPEPIINLPWGSFFIIHYLNEIKKERPYIDKVYPFQLYQRWALIHDTGFALRSIVKLMVWFFAFLLRPSSARQISFRQVLRILKETTVHPKLHKEAKRILFTHHDCHMVIFGHTHQAVYMCFAPGKEYFNTGTWNEKISLDIGSLGRTLRLTYVLIDYDKKNIPHGSLKEWKGRSNVVEDVVF
jgi:UDP-2,3-diacylglucosamine pyrophosphatase LpxH